MLDRLRRALAPRPFTEQKMFGGTCFMVDGHMVVGTSKRGLLVRVGKDGHAAALSRPHVRPMEMGGRTMQGYVFVEPAGVAAEAALRKWLDVALAFVSTLPPKAKDGRGGPSSRSQRRGAA